MATEHSPDLNLVDYSIWGCLQQLVYRQPIRDVAHLKEVIGQHIEYLFD